MNLKSFVDGLDNSEREELLEILTGRMNQSTTMPPHIAKEFEEEVEKPQRVQEDFTMHKNKSSNGVKNKRKEPVKARENTWTDTGEHREVSTPNVERTPRNRPAPKKKDVLCSACGKTFKVNASIVYGEYYRCERCVGKR